MTRLTMVLVVAGAATLLACDDDYSTSVLPQGGGDVGGQEVPDWTGQLVLGDETLTADDASTQEELPGLGRKFQLLLAMEKGVDPLNPTNDVLAVTTTSEHPAGAGVAVRNLNPGIRITALDNQINLKYYFPARTCFGGSPRIQLAISRDGDRESDGNAFGYVGNAPFGTGCITGDWDIIDMTDQVGRWDLSQFGGGMTMTWEDVERFFAAHPDHRVLSGSLVDDSCSFAPKACGEAYYDILTVENRTFENRQDAVEKK